MPQPVWDCLENVFPEEQGRQRGGVVRRTYRPAGPPATPPEGLSAPALWSREDRIICAVEQTGAGCEPRGQTSWPPPLTGHVTLVNELCL